MENSSFINEHKNESMIYCILNLKSGNRKESEKKEMITTIQSIPGTIVYITTYAKEAIQLTQKALSNKASKVIAIGGDGTVNEVASVLIGTNIPLGIIPIGSGNGLARHLGIPLEFKKSLQIALEGKPILIDVGFINNHPFFCTAGIGFDAAVAALFSKGKKRGLINYIKATIQALFKYQPISIKIENGLSEKIFSLTFANASQFGNNAYISPFSEIQDRQLEYVKIKPLSIYKSLILAGKLFMKKIKSDGVIEINSFHKMNIVYEKNKPIHIDGEYFISDTDKFCITIQPANLLVST